MANSSNITLRLAINGGTDTSLTYEQLDGNFLEVIDLIDDYNAHILSSDAHDAIDISFDNTYTSSEYTSTNVQDALEEIESTRRATQDQLDAHEADTTAHPASNITYSNTSSGLSANKVQGAIDEVEDRLDTAESDIVTNTSNLSSHISSSTAHDADSIVYDNVSSGLAATNTQQAIDEVEDRLDTAESGLSDHISSTSAHDASDLDYSNTASGLTATKVQDAIDEVDSNNDSTQSQLDTHESSTSAHASSDITYDNTNSGLTATKVQDAIDEVEGRLDTHVGDTTNPHNVTKSQVGLGNARNVASYSQNEADAAFQPILGGTTASRPASPITYQNYFDTTLGQPIWYDGTNWVDATGTTV